MARNRAAPQGLARDVQSASYCLARESEISPLCSILAATWICVPPRERRDS